MTTSTAPPPPASTRPPGPPPSEPPRHRPVGWGLLLLGAGVLWLLELTGVRIAWDVVLPAALVGVGLLVLTVGRRGRPDGLVGLGIVLTVAALLAALLPAPFSVSAGERNLVVASVEELAEDHQLGAGELTLDLRELELTEDASLDAAVGMGELVVRLPADVAVTGDARVGMGEIVAPDRERAGIAPRLSFSVPGDADAASLELDLGVGLGSIEVTR